MLTASYTQTCIGSNCAGGIGASLYLANKDDVASFAIDGNGNVTGITMVLTKIFYSFDAKDYTQNFQESTAVTDGCSSSVTQTFSNTWSCRNQEARNAIIEMAQQSCCGMIAIHYENTGKTWIWGLVDKNRVKLLTAESDTGTALTDANQTVLTFQCLTTVDGLSRVFLPGVAGIPV
jgi:hypothetical protein